MSVFVYVCFGSRSFGCCFFSGVSVKIGEVKCCLELRLVVVSTVLFVIFFRVDSFTYIFSIELRFLLEGIFFTEFSVVGVLGGGLYL